MCKQSRLSCIFASKNQLLQVLKAELRFYRNQNSQMRSNNTKNEFWSRKCRNSLSTMEQSLCSSIIFTTEGSNLAQYQSIKRWGNILWVAATLKQNGCLYINGKESACLKGGRGNYPGTIKIIDESITQSCHRKPHKPPADTKYFAELVSFGTFWFIDFLKVLHFGGKKMNSAP